VARSASDRPRRRTVDGAVPSPNIWQNSETYELENQAVDPDGVIESTLRQIHDWTDQDVLDLGCGTGFHLPRWAAGARSVVGVEPHRDLVAAARRRTAQLPAVRVLQGTAQCIPLQPGSVDVMQARWAYFFGPGCEPGLHELDRVMRRGGTAFVIDNDATRSTFGAWFRRGYPQVDPATVERFWSVRGWQRRSLDIRWSFRTREDLESVVRIEFSPGVAEEVLREHPGAEVDYAVNLWWRNY
jgi:SAM-dependent methyltransferase